MVPGRRSTMLRKKESNNATMAVRGEVRALRASNHAAIHKFYSHTIFKKIQPSRLTIVRTSGRTDQKNKLPENIDNPINLMRLPCKNTASPTVNRARMQLMAWFARSETAL